jgi:hypothetical protein
MAESFVKIFKERREYGSMRSAPQIPAGPVVATPSIRRNRKWDPSTGRISAEARLSPHQHAAGLPPGVRRLQLVR